MSATSPWIDGCRGPIIRQAPNPAEFASYVDDIRTVAEALGSYAKVPAAVEIPNRSAARRSWHATKHLSKGHVVCDGDLVALRPAVGVPANREIVGRRLAVAVGVGEPLREPDFEPLASGRIT